MIHLMANFTIACASMAFFADDWDKVVEEAAQKEQQVRIQTLVGMLTSANRIDPNEKINKSGRFAPPDYDEQAQVVVFLAIQQLLQEGSAAFDVLIENFDNQHYSFTHSPNGNFHVKVGVVCQQLMRRMIYCYEGEIDLITGDQNFIYPIKDEKEWWEKHRDQPLWKIQVEVIDEAIALFKNVDRQTARPISAKRREPLPEKQFEVGREKNLRVLHEIRAVILEREEAYVPKSLESRLDYYRMIGVPWHNKR